MARTEEKRRNTDLPILVGGITAFMLVVLAIYIGGYFWWADADWSREPGFASGVFRYYGKP